MFTENSNLKQIAEKVWVYKNFVSPEKVAEINKIMEQYRDKQDVPNHLGGTKHEEMLIDWYQNKTSPIIPELYPVWQDINRLISPEHQIHPQLFLTVTRENDEMFIHADSPGEEMQENLTVEDRWNTCCVLSHGAVVYFGDFDGGEVFYPHINSDGKFEGGLVPLNENRELRIQPEPGDLVIHGAHNDYAHGVHKIKSGYRYAFSNFVLPASKNPGTFPAYDSKENDERWNKGIPEWLTPINFIWEPSESLKKDIEEGRAGAINYK